MIRMIRNTWTTHPELSEKTRDVIRVLLPEERAEYYRSVDRRVMRLYTAMCSERIGESYASILFDACSSVIRELENEE